MSDDRHRDPIRPDEAERIPPDATEGERVSRDTSEGSLGYAQGAGHPGGEQDLDAKTESEAEHDESA
jgi:hypothetical protein